MAKIDNLLVDIDRLGEATRAFRNVLRSVGQRAWQLDGTAHTVEYELAMAGQTVEDLGPDGLPLEIEHPGDPETMERLQQDYDDHQREVRELEATLGTGGELKRLYEAVIRCHQAVANDLAKWPVTHLQGRNLTEQEVAEFRLVIERWLDAHHASQAEAAERFGVSQATLSRYMGPRTPTGEGARQILAAMEAPWFLDSAIERDVEVGLSYATRLLAQLGGKHQGRLARRESQRRLTQEIAMADLTSNQIDVVRSLISSPTALNDLYHWASTPDPLARVRGQIRPR